MNSAKWSKGLILVSLVCGVLFFVWFFMQNKNFPESDLDKSFTRNTPSTKIMLGQNFIVGIPGLEIDEVTKEVLRDIKPGGIVLYRRNYKSPEQFKSLIEDLQKIAKENRSEPFFIMIDEEPNGASRLDLLKDVFTLDLPDWGKIDQAIKTLEELGVNVVLAPVVDYSFNEDSFIKERVPVKTLTDLMAFNKTFIELLDDHGISATLKHFPGAGVFIDDPHEKLPSEYVNKDFFNQSISLFDNGIEAGAEFVMINHAIYENVDKDNPATLSYSIVTGLLKDQLGFEGIIITDDIEDMLSLVWDVDPIDAGIRSLKAGNTMIMYSQNIKDTKEIFNNMEERIEGDQELRNIIEGNYYDIIFFKQKRF